MLALPLMTMSWLPNVLYQCRPWMWGVAGVCPDNQHSFSKQDTFSTASG